jgi:putative ABC transport system ATP-binding protein
MQQVLVADNISKSFTTGTTVHHALKNVCLSVNKGEIVMLMGPSGSGKTTLLSIMGGILSPSSGEISIAGQSMTGVSSTKKGQLRLQHIGFIFQEYNLFPSLSALQNVQVALALRGESGKRARDEAATHLQSVGLGDKLDNHPSKLSGGQKQRLAIARALAGNPTLMLADEPTAALDSENGTIIMNLLKKLAREHNRAVVIVTHDNRIINFADRILRIEDGHLIGPSDSTMNPLARPSQGARSPSGGDKA